MNTKSKCDFELIGKRISNARNNKGMTQAQLAASVGIVDKHISEIERGISGVAVGTLIEIAKTLNVSTDYILLGSEPSTTVIGPLFEKITPRERYFLEQIVMNFIRCCLNEDDKTYRK